MACSGLHITLAIDGAVSPCQAASNTFAPEAITYNCTYFQLQLSSNAKTGNKSQAGRKLLSFKYVSGIF